MALFAMFVTFFFLTQLFQLVQHRSALAAGLLIVPASVGIVIGSGIAGKLINIVGPRVLVAAMTGAMLIGLLLLTRITVTSGAVQIGATLVLVGLGAGLGLPALTDTVMAAVPEDEAGVGSAVNDVSRQLGGALGVAVIGSIVSSSYRARLQHADLTRINPTAARAAQRSIGVATEAAKSLPRSVATQLLHTADSAYVHAITHGFYVSAAVMVAALVVALSLLPRRTRSSQAQSRHDSTIADLRTEHDRSALEPDISPSDLQVLDS
jgi:DHA2 family multidrug resistance protein-like MFS transporter